ncbi:MAG TPA: SDR family oxidoreductase [Methylotenera sp.]|jgi:NAD(P)-dependent dehydrogenase (short-subunit alcohol dehydrogenase family)
MTTTYQVLITGANRGIGLEFARQYAEAGWKVIACCRDLKQATGLQELVNTYPDIKTYALDVADFSAIEALAAELKDVKIDVLINNAGVYPHSDLDHADPEQWLHAFKVNSMAPFKMATAFAPNLAVGQLKKLVTLSSKMGSLDDNTSGGSYIYRTSKVAANMVMKSLAIDLKPYGISVAALHPGWVQTEMGGPDALIDTRASVSGLRNVIEHLNLANSGQFIAYDGKVINW